MGPEQAVDDAMQRICAGSVSTHALRGESDQMAHILAALMPEFQSTPSARRATSLYMALLHQRSISIHALREEGDCIMRL